MLPVLGGAEEQLKGLREDQHVFMPLDEDRLQRGVDVGAVADLDHLQRIEGIDHRTGPDRNAGGAQRAGKADDVVGHLARWRIEVIDVGHDGTWLLTSSFRDGPKDQTEDAQLQHACGSMDSGFTLRAPRNDS